MKKKINYDLLGLVASIICLIHCLFMPWILMVSSAWLSQYFTNEWFHHIMLGVAFLFGIPAFLQAYVKYKSKAVLFFGVAGLSLTSYGTMQEDNCCPHSQEAIVVEVEESSCANDSCSVDHSEKLAEVDNEESTLNIMSPVPMGVALILFAHGLNLRHRQECKISCCSNEKKE